MTKKTKLIIIFLLLIAIGVCCISHVVRIHQYNTSMQTVKERYDVLYQDLQNMNKDEKANFQDLHYEFAFFLTSYAEWEHLYRDLYQTNDTPSVHEELLLGPDDLVETFRNFRDLYYEYIEVVFFDENTISEDMMLELEDINERFSQFFVEISYFSTR